MNTEVMYMYESVHVPLKVNCVVPIKSSLRYACSYVTYTCTYTCACTVYVNKVTIQYSNYSVASFPHYSTCSSTVVLTVIGVLVNSTPQ